MEDSIRKSLSRATTGITAYEYLANNINSIDTDINEVVTLLIEADTNAQFIVSAARYLQSIDSEKFAANIDILIKAAIEIDREHNYIGQLLPGIWGEDYEQRAAELNSSDDNFRRIYKRIYDKNSI